MFDGTFFNFLTKKHTENNNARFEIDDYQQDAIKAARQFKENIWNPSSTRINANIDINGMW